jgi:hypothetical protein
MTAPAAALSIAMFLLVSHVHGTVYGYLDPGTGSVAIQLVLGTLVALLATVKLYWARINSFERRPSDPDVAPERR